MAAFALTVPAALLADSLKLKEVASGGRVFFEDQIALDAGRALLSADEDGDGVFDIFSVTLAGDTPVRLNEPLAPPYTFAFPQKLSPNGDTVLFGVDGDAGEQLFSVPVAGPDTASVQLNLEVAWDLDISRTFISADGQRVAFEGNQQDEELYELFSVPTAGPAGAMRKLNGPLLSGGIALPVISRDQQIIVYQADQDPLELRNELYAVPIDGSTAPVQIAGGGSLGTAPVVTASTAVYWRNGALFSVPLEGPASAATEISIIPSGSDRVRASFFEVTPDGQTVVYFVTSDEGEYLYSVPIEGPASAGVRITPEGQDVVEFKLAGNNAVVYDQRRPTGGRDLYITSIGGPSSEALRLNPDFDLTNGGVREYQVSPDGAWVAYQASLERTDQTDLRSVPTTGPASAGVILSPPLPDASDVFFDFVISPDSQRVAYRVDLDSNDVFELYSVAITGPSSTNVKLNPPLAGGGDVCANSASCYRFAPDSRRVVFEAEADADNEVELFIADDGQAAAAFTTPVQTVFEGSTVILDIDIGSPSVFPVTLQVTQTGGTASSADYSLSADVLIAPGMTTTQVPLTVVADTDSDAGETLELSLTGVQNAQLGIPFVTVLTIRPEGEIFFDGFE